MIVKFKKLDLNAKTPTYAKEGDAAMDLVATDVQWEEEFMEYGTGIAVEIPEGHVGLLFPRSSVTKKRLMLKNSVGIIDSGYRGEIKLRFNRTSEDLSLNNMYAKGERVGQLMIIPIPRVEMQEVEELSDSSRGEGGFGSTGE